MAGVGNLTRDAAGNLYGTTSSGGSFTCGGSACGTVFKLNATGKEMVLYNFGGSSTDGNNPKAGLIRDTAGNLYGTTENGGTYGFGTVFKVDKTGKETVLYSFAGSPTDGELPEAGLIRDSADNLYGTTAHGGQSGAGTVFKLDTSGKEIVLYSFTGGSTDGEYPIAGLIRDAAGNFYGTTYSGGDLSCASGFGFGCGTVFKLDKTGKESVLHSFTGADGASPQAGLIRDSAGTIYGTTVYGGDFSCGVWGCGTVFTLDTAGKESVLYNFGTAGALDGTAPYASLIRDTAGNLYGTTLLGGAASALCGGTVFKLDKTGRETTLHSFGATGDGCNPFGGLVRDAAGNFYGATEHGGNSSSVGTLFKITP